MPSVSSIGTSSASCSSSSVRSACRSPAVEQRPLVGRGPQRMQQLLLRRVERRRLQCHAPTVRMTCDSEVACSGSLRSCSCRNPTPTETDLYPFEWDLPVGGSLSHPSAMMGAWNLRPCGSRPRCERSASKRGGRVCACRRSAARLGSTGWHVRSAAGGRQRHHRRRGARPALAGGAGRHGRGHRRCQPLARRRRRSSASAACGQPSAAAKRLPPSLGYAPVSQSAEEAALKAAQCGFEPHRGHEPTLAA